MKRQKSFLFTIYAQYLLLHIDCPLVREYKCACMPGNKDLSIGYFQGFNNQGIFKPLHTPRKEKIMEILYPDVELTLDTASIWH